LLLIHPTCTGVGKQVWAMNDVVQEKLRAKLDDDHMIGELFFRKANEWYSLGKHRDEL